MHHMIQSCKHCNTVFTITGEDQAFYDKVSPVFNEQKLSIPPPELCPECRQKMRLRFQNERNLYGRQCDLCKKDIIAVYPRDTVGPVYCPECWWSDKWNAFDYGLDIEWSKNIASYWRKLLSNVPKLSLVSLNSENTVYAHDAENNKNCYLVFTTINSEDSLYLSDSIKMRNCIDCFGSANCELCYNVISGEDCYNCFHCIHCYQISFSYFCYDCQNCSNCFGCFNINHKEYHIFNKPYEKEVYEKQIAIYKERMKTWQGYEEVWDEVKEFWQTQPHKYAANVSLNCTGDFLANSKNCEESFNVVYSLDCKYIYDCVDMKDSQDCNISGHAELIYNCQSCSGFMNICCSFCAHSSNLYYCDHCFNCTNCFGCVGLTHQNYCIYNKQYSQEEYEKLIPRIIDQMKSNWGEFFPSEIAPISELDCVINDFFPASTDKRIDTIVKEAKVYPEVVDNKMQCIACNKDFLIIKQEQVFYQTHQLPFPPLCPTCRHRRRIQQRNPRILYSRKCNKCGQPVTSTFAESNPVQIYCEKCYQEAR